LFDSLFTEFSPLQFVRGDYARESVGGLIRHFIIVGKLRCIRYHSSPTITKCG